MPLPAIAIGIVIGLIVNGLTTLVSYGLQKVGKTVKYKGDIRKALEKDTALILDIQEVLANIAKTEPFSSNKSLSSKVQSFLNSPAAESIVRQIYSDYMVEGRRQKSIKQLREEFQICFANHLGVGVPDVKQIATELFQIISVGCHKAFDIAINQGILSAHEAKSIARHRVVLDELRAIEHNLSFLTAGSYSDLKTIEDFEKQYRCQVGIRHDQITIPHFDRAPTVDIDDVFVSPNFICPPKEESQEREMISLEDFLARLYRSVLLGDPGGGKSTLAQKICHDLNKSYERRLIGDRLLTPVLVILREYSAKKKKDGSSVIQFIESEVTSKYQLPQEAPSGAFEYLLHNGHLLVIFDGLDELLEPSYRREISKDIVLFCNLFPSVPVLVTSRVVGYEQAPLNPDNFETFHLASFTDKQVSEYVNKWFNNDTSLIPDERKRRAEAFLLESSVVSDLRSNPLMLALMCNLYRGAGFIPRNRPEVYKKCSEMLFERWDPSRDIRVQLPISEPKVLLGYLAHWIYSDESLQSGVAEDAIVKEASRFLCPRRFESEEEAEKASCEFIEFCRGRAWVFTDVGTTPEGKDLYKFTHKTFLEYFTAAYIVRNNNTPEKLWALLRPKIAERAWDVVAQLAFQMLHEQVEGASDELLNLLLQDAEKKEEIWAFLSFGTRCLQFIFPSPKTIRALTEASVRTLVEVPNSGPFEKIEDGIEFDVLRYEPVVLTKALLSAAPECRSTIADSIERTIVNYAKSADNRMALRAIDLGLTLQTALDIHTESSFGQEMSEYWSTVEMRIFKQVNAKLENLAPHDFFAFLHWADHSNDLSIEQLFEWYTPDHLWEDHSYVVFKNVFGSSIGADLLEYSPGFGVAVKDAFLEDIEVRSRAAGKLGRILLHTQFPCFTAEKVDFWSMHDELELVKDPLMKVPISWDVIFGLWCLWATTAELGEEQEHTVKDLEKIRSPVIKAIFDVLQARKQEINPDEVLQSLKDFNIPKNALEFVKRWITGQVSFVAPPKRRDALIKRGEQMTLEKTIGS